ncbi:MAG: hypothetical protein AD742_07690 [Methylibium sp. NZG]|nr:MAG: hypothetical protein AD742_07690 [Methylibium sp. NZG]
MVEKSFAALVALVCLVLLARLFMPERYRWRLDAWARGVWRSLRSAAQRVWGLRHWRSSRQQAARMADDAIRRARHGVERDGNVLRPKSFGDRGGSRGSRESRDTGEPRKPH